MLDNSLAVITAVSRTIKKFLFAIGIITQIVFIGYYAYLIAVNVNTIYLLVCFIIAEIIAVGVLFIHLFTLDLTGSKAKFIKSRTKRSINIVSWVLKAAVIGFNIYVAVNNPTTQTGLILLLFSSIFLLIQIIFTLISWLLNHYVDVFVYALKMDYENIRDDDENINNRPIAQTLNRYTELMDYRDKVNELAVKSDIYNSVKEILKKNEEFKINGKVVKRRKAEKIILRYYNKANTVYLTKHSVAHLCKNIDKKLGDKIKSDDQAFVLAFFLHNHLDGVYKGVSEYALKLIIGNFLFVLDGNDTSIIDLGYRAVLKEMIDIKEWTQVLDDKKREDLLCRTNREFQRAMNMIKYSKDQYELYKEETVTSEFEGLIFKVIRESVLESGKKVVRRTVKDLFLKKDV